MSSEQTLNNILDHVISTSIEEGGWDRWEDPSPLEFSPMSPGDWSYDGEGPDIIDVSLSRVPGFVAPVIDADSDEPIEPYGDTVSIRGPGRRVRGGSVCMYANVAWKVRRIEVIDDTIKVAVTYETTISEDGEPDEPDVYYEPYHD